MTVKDEASSAAAVVTVESKKLGSGQLADNEEQVELVHRDNNNNNNSSIDEDPTQAQPDTATTNLGKANTRKASSCTAKKFTKKASSALSELMEQHRAAVAMPLYVHPKQRQRWGDTQVHPVKNWGDIFFDLFYVAAAYNLGNMLKHDPTSRGLLYMVGCFLPIIGVWLQKLIYDARFYVGDDLFHRFYEVAVFLAIASAILHIQPLAILEHGHESSAMLAYALSIAVGCALAAGRFAEVAFVQRFFPHRSVGLHPEAFHAAMHQVLLSSSSLVFYIAAAIYAGLQYYGDYGVTTNTDATSSYEGYNHTDGSTNTSAPHSSANDTSSSEVVTEEHLRRFLASSASEARVFTTSPTDITVYLLLGGAFAHFLAMAFVIIVLFSPRWMKDSKAVTVPMNIDYCIHRYGEWTMLLLGESVLSLLIVKYIPSLAYVKIFYCGIVSITLLAYLHFRSQPHHADEHAMRRHRVAGFWFAELFQVYSVVLVVLGASFKMFLSEQVDTASSAATDSSHRRHRRTILSRWLASDAAATSASALESDPTEKKQHIAMFYCISLALVWLCMDLMLLLHRGVRKHHDRLEDCNLLRCATVYFLFLVRVGLIAFMACFWLISTEPAVLAFVGLWCIVLQLLTREALERIFGNQHHHHQSSSAHDGKVGEPDDSHQPTVSQNEPFPSHAEGEAIG